MFWPVSSWQWEQLLELVVMENHYDFSLWWERYIHIHPHPLRTILQGLSDHLLWGRSCARPVRSLDHHAVLGELLQVVQYDVLCGVSCSVQTDDGELVATARTVFPVAHLVATNHSILQVPLGRLQVKKRWYLRCLCYLLSIQTLRWSMHTQSHLLMYCCCPKCYWLPLIKSHISDILLQH